MGNKKAKGQRGSAGLGGLADALVKAGVAEPKAARQARQDRRRTEKELGPDEIRRRAAARDGELAAAKRAADEASRASARDKDEQATEERARGAIRANLEPARGNKRWYFVARDGRVPFVDVSDAVMRALGDGEAGITESLGVTPEAHVVVGSRQALTLLQRYDREVVRFWNRGPRSGGGRGA